MKIVYKFQAHLSWNLSCQSTWMTFWRELEKDLSTVFLSIIYIVGQIKNVVHFSL